MRKRVWSCIIAAALLACLPGCCVSHDWAEATCTQPETCSKCGKEQGAALGHAWEAATCAQPKTCKACGEEKGEALGHDVIEWTVTTEATCTEPGEEIGTCSRCGETVRQETALKEHTPGDWVITEYPTETAKGTQVKYCTVCQQEVETQEFEMSADEMAELYKGRCETIAYDTLSRSPDDYKGKLVKFSGRILQVCAEAESSLFYSTYRVATNGRYDDVVYLRLSNYGSGQRILEDDYITFYGSYDGLFSYKTVLGATLTIPQITARYYE